MSSAKSTTKGAIELLPTNVARVSSLAHPILLLSAYYQRFPELVAQPVPTLLSALWPLAGLQIAYVVTCLPIVGPRAARAKRPHVAASPPAWRGAHIPTILIALVLTGLSVPVLVGLEILFGAPVTTHLPQTGLAAAHLALLTLFPLFCVHGMNPAKWREIAAASSPFDEVFGAAVGAFVGGWLGAVPIPLDWDRDWQKWPVTVLTGIYLGYVVGKLVGCGMTGTRIMMD